jgi:hypothetical protein
MITLITIFFGIIFFGGIAAIGWTLYGLSLFKRGHNPYSRICKTCGAHQTQYQSNIEGMEDHVWWEEVYPLGNNPKCPCHKFAEYHD